mgnify:CR=1 FL=1
MDARSLATERLLAALKKRLPPGDVSVFPVGLITDDSRIDRLMLFEILKLEIKLFDRFDRIRERALFFEFGKLARRPEGVVTELPDGHSVVSKLFRLPNGGTIGTHEDCTEQRQLSRKLASTTQFLESVLDNVPVCVAAKSIEDGLAVDLSVEQRLNQRHRVVPRSGAGDLWVKAPRGDERQHPFELGGAEPVAVDLANTFGSGGEAGEIDPGHWHRLGEPHILAHQLHGEAGIEGAVQHPGREIDQRHARAAGTGGSPPKHWSRHTPNCTNICHARDASRAHRHRTVGIRPLPIPVQPMNRSR